jgi:hypothetical protein
VVINSMPFALNLCFVLMCFFASKIKMQSIGCTLSLKEKSKCEIFECTAAVGGAASDEVHYAHHPPLLNSYLGVVKQVLHRSKRDNRLYAIKIFHKSRLCKLRVSPTETAMMDVLREVSRQNFKLL